MTSLTLVALALVGFLPAVLVRAEPVRVAVRATRRG